MEELLQKINKSKKIALSIFQIKSSRKDLEEDMTMIEDKIEVVEEDKEEIDKIEEIEVIEVVAEEIKRKIQVAIFKKREDVFSLISKPI